MRPEQYQKYIWPILEKTNPNVAHEKAIEWLEKVQELPFGSAVIERLLVGERFESDRLRVDIAGLHLDNPLILAAGFDKNGRVVEAMHALGFSSVVVGTVTEWPQEGLPGQTIFRPEEGVLINRMGFPNIGMQGVESNLRKYGARNYPIGVSISAAAKLRVFKELGKVADYVVINASSPNTPGLRYLQSQEVLKSIVEQLDLAQPIFVKVSPDINWTDLDGVIRLVIDGGLAGIVATNTTTDRGIKVSLGGRWENQAGGVSGFPLENKSNDVIRHIYEESGGQVEIMGVGGVDSLESVLAKFSAGAKVVKLLTGLVYKGPGLPNQLNRELDQWMANHGVANVAELVGESCL